jgi:hypothetical protein
MWLRADESYAHIGISMRGEYLSNSPSSLPGPNDHNSLRHASALQTLLLKLNMSRIAKDSNGLLTGRKEGIADDEFQAMSI